MMSTLGYARKGDFGGHMLFFLMTVAMMGLLLSACGSKSSTYSSGSTGTTGNPTGSAGPGSFSLTSPANSATDVSITPNFVWIASSGATGYQVQLKTSTVQNFTQIAALTAPTTNYLSSSALSPGMVYNWQVIAVNAAGTLTAGPWSFTTASSGTPPAPTVQVVVCPTSGTTDVAIQNFAFVPFSVTATISSIVKWTNNDTVTHTVTSTTVPANSSFDTTVNAGASVCLKFTAAGSYTYHCSFHGFMTGALTIQ